MALTYKVDDQHFILSYSELRNSYREFCEMSDDEFLNNIPYALHLACVICFLKEVPTYVCLSDTGIIHELTHLLKGPDLPVASLKAIRESFEVTLKLS